MVIVLKDLLWILSTGIAFAGAWFVKFTREDPNTPHKLALTPVGLLTLPLAVIAFLLAFLMQIADQRAETAKAKKAESEKNELRAQIVDIKGGVRELTSKVAEAIRSSPSIQQAIESDTQAAASIDDFFRRAVDIDPTLRDVIAQNERFQTGNLQKTDLEQAVNNADRATVRRLLKAGADTEAVGDLGMTPLQLATLKKDVETAKLLLTAGANINGRSKFVGSTPLLTAVPVGDITIVRFLLDHGADVNVPDRFGDTPLLAATLYKRHEMLKLFLGRGAKPNVFTTGYGDTPLKQAAFHESKDDVVALLNAGADPNLAPPPRGETVLIHLLQRRGCPSNETLEIIRLLVAKGAKCNTTDSRGVSPLTLAIQNNCPIFTDLFVRCGADVNKCGFPGGRSCLAAAKQFHYQEVQTILERAGAK